MYYISDLVTPERVVSRDSVSSKKRALELLSKLIVIDKPELIQTEVFDSMIERERLGSTGLGHGAAIPHGRLKSLQRPVCAFLQLKQGVDFDAVDGVPADLICALFVPEESTDEHLKILSMLAEMFSDEDFCVKLRNATTGEKVYALLTKWQSGKGSDHEERPCA